MQRSVRVPISRNRAIVGGVSRFPSYIAVLTPNQRASVERTAWVALRLR
jgi:hypothetical protein